jgi:serine/threonine protein kinase
MPTQPSALAQRYRLLEGRMLGRGRSAVVCEAVDRRTGERVAVKTLERRRAHPRGSSGSEDDEDNSLAQTHRPAAMARREARLLARAAGHPNVVRLHAAYYGDEHDDDKAPHHPHPHRPPPRLVLELASGGEALLERVQRQQHRVVTTGESALPEATVRAVMRALLSAVEHLHGRGIVHRDVKLDNVLLRGRGGSSRRQQRQHEKDASSSSNKQAPLSVSPAPSWRIGAADNAAVAVLEDEEEGEEDEDDKQHDDDDDDDDDGVWLVDDASPLSAVRALERRVLLVDFGLSAMADELLVLSPNNNNEGEGRAAAPVVGTSLYLSPELAAAALSGRASPLRDPRAADVYACGVVAFVLLAAYPPYWATEDADVVRMIAGGADPAPLPSSLSPGARGFLARALERDPSRRPSAGELLRTDDWLAAVGKGGGDGRARTPVLPLQRLPASPPPPLPLPSVASIATLERLIDDALLLTEGRRSRSRLRQRRQCGVEAGEEGEGGGESAEAATAAEIAVEVAA